MRTLNKGCLQKPKEQTRCFVKTRPNQHMRCREDMREWLKVEEDKINRRFKPNIMMAPAGT